jgi:hypothetical protein
VVFFNVQLLMTRCYRTIIVKLFTINCFNFLFIKVSFTDNSIGAPEEWTVSAQLVAPVEKVTEPRIPSSQDGSSLRKTIGRYHDLVDRYGMTGDHRCASFVLVAADPHGYETVALMVFL